MVALFTLLLATTAICNAQPTAGFELLMHYPLVNSGADVTGKHGAVELLNTRYAGDSGVWQSGIYIHDTIPGGSLVRTPEIESLRKDSIIISVEIYVDRLDGANHAILVAGDSWRYLGCGYGPQGEFFMFVNGNSFNVPDFELPVGVWQTVGISYTLADSAARLYLNDVVKLERRTGLFAPEDDNRISNSHFGWGVAMGGYMRNLRVWQPDNGVSSVRIGPDENYRGGFGMAVYPNPASGQITVTGGPEWERVAIVDLHGRSVVDSNLEYPSSSVTLNSGRLPTGLYVIRAISVDQSVRTGRILIVR